MAHIIPTRPAPFGAVTALRFGSFLADVYARIQAWNTARKTSAELAKLSDHQLSDIGLTRGDLDSFTARF